MDKIQSHESTRRLECRTISTFVSMALHGVKKAVKDLHHLNGSGLVVAARAQGKSEKTKVATTPHPNMYHIDIITLAATYG